MSKNKKIILAIIVCGLIFAILPSFAMAADTGKLINPIGGTSADPKGTTDISVLIGKVIKAALGVVGSIALLMFIYGGFLWLTSAGSEQKITQGKQVIVWAVIGLAIIFLSYAAVDFVIKGITGGTSNTLGTCTCTGGGGYTTQGTQAACSATASAYQPCTWNAGTGT